MGILSLTSLFILRKMQKTTIDWSNGSLKISQFFTVGEVTKGDVRRQPKPGSFEEQNILILAKELDKIRTDWGGPIRVTSWFRPPAINRAVGGASRSQHINGRAVDIQAVGKDIYQFQTFLDKNWFGFLGYGAKKGFVHLDMRNAKGWKSSGVKGGRFNY